jgi:hypothetical protein
MHYIQVIKWVYGDAIAWPQLVNRCIDERNSRFRKSIENVSGSHKRAHAVSSIIKSVRSITGFIVDVYFFW